MLLLLVTPALDLGPPGLGLSHITIGLGLMTRELANNPAFNHTIHHKLHTLLHTF